MRTVLLLPALLLLTACATTTDGTMAGPGGTCRGEPLASFVGQPASAELGARMLRESGARTLRWVPKGGAVTMDFRDDRLTVALDEANRVERANCG